MVTRHQIVDQTETWPAVLFCNLWSFIQLDKNELSIWLKNQIILMWLSRVYNTGLLTRHSLSVVSSGSVHLEACSSMSLEFVHTWYSATPAAVRLSVVLWTGKVRKLLIHMMHVLKAMKQFNHYIWLIVCCGWQLRSEPLGVQWVSQCVGQWVGQCVGQWVGQCVGQ